MSDWSSPPPPPPPEGGSPGPGYWLASDGRWYPPSQAPAGAPTAQPAYGQPGYGYPGYGYAPAPSNGMATAAVVLAVIGLCLCWVPVLGAGLSTMGIIFGFVGLSKAKEIPGEPLAGRARAGLITGIVGAVIGVVLTIVIIAAVPWDEIDSDPPDGFCDEDRFFQDPDC